MDAEKEFAERTKKFIDSLSAEQHKLFIEAQKAEVAFRSSLSEEQKRLLETL